jgi:hypothetical protein
MKWTAKYLPALSNPLSIIIIHYKVLLFEKGAFWHIFICFFGSHSKNHKGDDLGGETWSCIKCPWEKIIKELGWHFLKSIHLIIFHSKNFTHSAFIPWFSHSIIIIKYISTLDKGIGKSRRNRKERNRLIKFSHLSKPKV